MNPKGRLYLDPTLFGTMPRPLNRRGILGDSIVITSNRQTGWPDAVEYGIGHKVGLRWLTDRVQVALELSLKQFQVMLKLLLERGRVKLALAAEQSA